MTAAASASAEHIESVKQWALESLPSRNRDDVVSKYHPARSAVRHALINFGYHRSDVERALKKSLRDVRDVTQCPESDELKRRVLQELAKQGKRAFANTMIGKLAAARNGPWGLHD
jgi:Holliday junction resolvasome RuvABC DNA-binding subunit